MAHVSRKLTCAIEHISPVGTGASHDAGATRCSHRRRASHACRACLAHRLGALARCAMPDRTSTCFKKHAQAICASSLFFFFWFLLHLNSDFKSVRGAEKLSTSSSCLYKNWILKLFWYWFKWWDKILISLDDRLRSDYQREESSEGRYLRETFS